MTKSDASDRRSAAKLISKALLKDPAGLFNSSLGGNVRRAIDIHDGDKVDASAFKGLVREAVALNRSGESTMKKKAKRS